MSYLLCHCVDYGLNSRYISIIHHRKVDYDLFKMIIIFILITIQSCLSSCLYQSKHSNITSVLLDSSDSKYYLLKQGRYQLITTPQDAIFLSYNESNICQVKDFKRLHRMSLIEGEPLQSIIRNNRDDICKRDEDYQRIAIMSNNYRMIISHDVVGEYLNPSIIPNPWMKQFPQYVYLMINRKKRLFFLDDSYKVIRMIDDHEYIGELPVLKGFDFRLLSMHTELYVTSSINIRPYFNRTCIQRQTMKRIRLLKNGTFKSFPTITFLSEPIREDLNDRKFNKNWVPFIYSGELHLISDISKMTVAKLTDSVLPTTVFDMTIQIKHVIQSDTSDCEGIDWNHNYGSMRGGSPALKIGNEYLAFFHSNDDRYCGARNYYMGAFTFTSIPPFKLTKISRYPIADKNNQNLNDLVADEARLASVVFPMSFFLQDKSGSHVNNILYEPTDYDDGTVVLLTTGVYDKFGIIWKLNLFELMTSLKPITC